MSTTEASATTPRAAGGLSLLKKLLLVVVVLVAAFVVIVALQPTVFQVRRETTIHAPAEVVFAQVNDFHAWNAWSPWAKRDPQAKNSFEGPASGPGAIFRWSGNDEIGEGQMTLTESTLSSLIRIKLEFIRPFADTAETEFAFEPVGDATQVRWTMTGENNFMAKLFGLLMDMDKMVGGDFETGLANLKEVAEGAKAAQ